MFQIQTPTEARILSITNRVEKHGEDDVPAMSIGLKFTTSNKILDLFPGNLRRTFYTRPEGQEDLPGMEESTPLLRANGIELVSLDAKFEGWTLNVEHGIDENDPISCGGAKVDKFRFKPLEGGSLDLFCRVGTSDVSAEEAGLLWSKNGQNVSVTLIAPDPKKEPSGAGASGGPVIDGTKGHPGAAASGGPDPTDLFVAGGDGKAGA